MSTDLTMNVAASFARYTQAAGQQALAVQVIKTQAQGEAALADMIMEQAAAIAAYDHHGRFVAGDEPSLDVRI